MKTRSAAVVVLMLGALAGGTALGQTSPPKVPYPKIELSTPTSGAGYASPDRPRKPESGPSYADDDKPGQGPVALSIGVAVFAALIVGGLVFLRLKSQLSEGYFFRLTGLALVVQAGLFLIVAGYTQQQITPMMGLLGTVAGYMLGKGEDGKG